MPRYGLIVEYFGPAFHGWQRQTDITSVQEVLETAIYAFTREAVALAAAGRTDAGVHATAQVAHVDLVKEYPAHTVLGAMNFHLHDRGAIVRQVWQADPEFHARFSATGRRYRYRILNRPVRSVLEQGRAWWFPGKLDIDAMQKAANYLLGTHDFSSFRAKDCQAQSPQKTLDRFHLTRVGEEIHCEVAARSFLHHQVRNMVGTLKLVGEGRWQPEDVRTALAACKRAAAGPTAPACGLYLTGVTYPPSLVPADYPQ